MAPAAPTTLRRFAAYMARFWQPNPTVTTIDGLAEQLAAQAMFVSQKCTVEYLRLRAGVQWDTLCRDAAFRDGYERCRWGGYVRILGDVAEVAEIVLRAAGLAPDAIEGLVPAAVATALGRYPPTPHEPSVSEAAEQIRLRLARRRLEPPRPLRRIGAGSASRLMALMPFDERLQAADLDYLDNNLSFALAQMHERMRGTLDPAALATARH